ncbi:DUF4374 domain-containing protein [Pedobacter sp. MC2016-24]|uniref:DUF4374 domain-containing protein n=1 Tax=Pedobacter sp. MC2016-24 TaxID=2780090 RepID=UPI00187E09D4|nr:DUF4374 domain-containing protein [Pedobacter sp. MC2016-24]MBE9599835.1 DUF4374 domain-containing protein [Pedobacter sp. MC2016-24]
MKFNKQFLLLPAVAMMLLSACSKDKPIDNPVPNLKEKFVIAGTAATAEQDKAYLFLTDNLDAGEITVKGNGYETSGETMFTLNNKVFAFKYNRGDPGFTEVFNLDEQSQLKKVSSFSVKSVNVFLPYKDQKHLLAYSIGRSLATPGSAYWINTESNIVDRDAQFDQKIIYVDGKLIPNYYAFVYSFFEFGDKLYAVYQPTYGGTGEKDKNDYRDRAFISVFDKDMKFIKTISDTRMPYIGKYYNVMGLGQSDNGDIYAFSTGDVQSTNNHSAFLRLKNDEFDKSYYWDVEAIAGKKIHAGKHLGNNKFILSMVDRDETKAGSEGVKLAFVDVAQKQFTWVTGIDAKIPADFYGSPLFINNGKAYLPLSSEQTSVSYLYVIDPSTNTAKRGLKLIGIKDVSGMGVLKK